MSDPIAIIILVGGFAILMALKVPVAFSLALSAFASAWYFGSGTSMLPTVAQQLVSGVRPFNFMAIPFFIIAGNLMGEGGIGKRMIDLADALVGRVRGGLAMVNVLSSKFFGTVSGSVVADTSALGTIMIPMMEKQGYDKEFATANTVTSSIVGLLIPPSHNMIIFAMAAGGGVSIAALFLAGIVPALVLGIGLMMVSYIISVKKKYPKGKKYTIKETLKLMLDGVLAVLTIVIIVGGITSGMFTATEASVIAVVYAFIITFFVYREIPLKRFWPIMKKSVRTVAMVMAIIAASSAFGYMMTILRVPDLATNAILAVSDNPLIILLLINVILLVLGLVMDMAPMILITTPILLPVATQVAGMHPVQFGIVLLLNLGISLITPPVGTVLFVGCSIGRTKIEDVIKPLLPYYFVMILVLLLITYVPTIALWLPNTFLS
ncbi:MAG: TRAP transporter large permease [Oscillospiraceae bacterium]|nr:TRAP transporter large permease [Oscillospiraceae bacterium]